MRESRKTLANVGNPRAQHFGGKLWLVCPTETSHGPENLDDTPETLVALGGKQIFEDGDTVVRGKVRRPTLRCCSLTYSPRRLRKDARTAMDAAMRDVVKQAAKDAETAAIRRMRAVADAETFVQPWVGHLAIAQDSAEEVYRAALATLGVDIAGVHASAYRAILEAQPKPGTQRALDHGRLALDSASMKSFAERYPHAAAIKQLG